MGFKENFLVKPFNKRKKIEEKKLVKRYRAQGPINKRKMEEIREKAEDRAFFRGVGTFAGLAAGTIACAYMGVQAYIGDNKDTKIKDDLKEYVVDVGDIESNIEPETELSEEDKQLEIINKKLDVIDNFKNANQVKSFYKNLYASLYQQKTGKYISSDDIAIISRNQAFIYYTEYGRFVTHSGVPGVVEKRFKDNGIGYERKEELDFYTVKNNAKDEIIEAFAFGEEGPISGVKGGDYLAGIEKYEASIIPDENIADIISEAISLADLYENDFENGDSNVKALKSRLAELYKEYLIRIMEEQLNKNKENNTIDEIDGIEEGI